MQQIMMVWQNHRRTLYSPDMWARCSADTAACLCRGLPQQVGHEPISADLGGLGTCSILPVAWTWMLTQISLTQLSRTWHLSPVSSPSPHHVWIQPWKKVKLEPRREKNANWGILGAGWGRIQTDQQSRMSPKVAQNLTEISLILKINKSQLSRG